jgi:hypothetical protein
MKGPSSLNTLYRSTESASDPDIHVASNLADSRSSRILARSVTGHEAHDSPCEDLTSLGEEDGTRKTSSTLQSKEDRTSHRSCRTQKGSRQILRRNKPNNMFFAYFTHYTHHVSVLSIFFCGYLCLECENGRHQGKSNVVCKFFLNIAQEPLD